MSDELGSLISGFRRDVDEICGLLGYYTALCGNCLPTFRDNVSVPSSRVKIPSSVWKCHNVTIPHSSLCNFQIDRLVYLMNDQMGNLERLGLRYKACASKLFMARATLVIVGWFVGRMWENNYVVYLTNSVIL
jgi:hypothetical protein